MTLAERIGRVRARSKAIHQLPPEDEHALLVAEELLRRMAAGMEFSVRTIVSSRTKEGMVEVKWGQEPPVQMTVGKARETAWMLIEAAAIAETDEALCKFLQRELGQDEAAAMTVVQSFRSYRAANPLSSLAGVNPDDDPDRKPS